MEGHFSRAAERALDKSDLPTAATSTPPAKSILEIIEVVRRYRVRACGHLSQASAQTKCNPARKFRAVFSYRVAIARKCLIMQKNRSTRLRSQ